MPDGSGVSCAVRHGPSDSNVRTALIDRFGGKAAALGQQTELVEIGGAIGRQLGHGLARRRISPPTQAVAPLRV